MPTAGRARITFTPTRSWRRTSRQPEHAWRPPCHHAYGTDVKPLLRSEHGLFLGRGGYIVNRYVRAVVFVFLIHPQTHDHLESPIDECTPGERHHDAKRSARHLRTESDPAQAAERLGA